MFIQNINEEVRKFFSQKYSHILEFEDSFVDDFLDSIEFIKKENQDFYKSILQAFYPIFYISNLERIGEIEAAKKIEADYDAEDEFVYDVEFLKTITTLEELIDEIEKNPYMMIEMLDSNLTFYNMSELEKRGMLIEYVVCDEYLKKISKTWVLDRINYCRKYTKKDFFEKGITLNESIKNNDNSYSIELDNLVSFLRDLAIFDFETFLDLFNLIIEDSFYFLKYQSHLNPDNKFIDACINKIENLQDFSKENVLNDKKFIKVIIESFFRYNNCEEEEKEKIKASLDNPKQYKI